MLLKQPGSATIRALKFSSVTSMAFCGKTAETVFHTVTVEVRHFLRRVHASKERHKPTFLSLQFKLPSTLEQKATGRHTPVHFQ